jgi:hypothetical protein
LDSHQDGEQIKDVRTTVCRTPLTRGFLFWAFAHVFSPAQACAASRNRSFPGAIERRAYLDFDQGKGTTALYGSAVVALQGFVWQERTIGLPCQLEADASGLDECLQHAAADLRLPVQVQDSASIRDGAPHAASANATLFRLLDYLSGAHAHMT